MADEQWKPKQHVIRADKAIQCCTRQRRIVSREILGLLNSFLSGIVAADRNSVLALVPAVGSLAAGGAGVATVAALTPAAAAAAVATLGAVVFAEGLDLLGIIEEKAAVATIGAFSSAISNYIDIAEQTAAAAAGARVGPGTATKTKTTSDCEDCVKSRIFGSGKRRERQRVKILRRV